MTTKKSFLIILATMLLALQSGAQESASEPLQRSADEAKASQDGGQEEVAEQTEQSPTTKSSIQLKTTSVTGSRELPKVLVIVPWKTSESVSPGERPLASLVEEALTPLDPDVFRRELDYYTDLESNSAKQAGSEKK